MVSAYIPIFHLNYFISKHILIYQSNKALNLTLKGILLIKVKLSKTVVGMKVSCCLKAEKSISTSKVKMEDSWPGAFDEKY